MHGRGKGDLFVRVVIKVPDKLTERQRELLREFAAEQGETVSGGKKRTILERIRDTISDIVE